MCWLAAFLLAGLAACSQSLEQQRSGEEKGGIRVVVHDLTEGEVQLVEIDLVPDGSAADPGAAPISVSITRNDPRVSRDASGQPITWSWTESNLDGGSYLISAKAYEDSNPDPAAQPIFESAAVPVRIVPGPVATITLFLRQDGDGGEQETPYVTAVRFSAQPEAGGVSRITVWGEGGEGRSPSAPPAPGTSACPGHHLPRTASAMEMRGSQQVPSSTGCQRPQGPPTSR